MRNAPIEWSLDGFVEHFEFIHHKMLDHKFVWVLGAGASLASGIPLGSDLVDRWLREMHLKENAENAPFDQWATAEKLGINGFKFNERARSYPEVYQRRFQDYPEEGYAYLESLMSGKDPSPGYSILAAALAADPPRHNVVITTNFDNLISDALAIYTDTFPFVCGHESLTAFVRVAMRRPLICKIHRDLLLGPQNDTRRLSRLHDAWGTALRALFQHFTPIFIGYGGNDDTLMSLLKSLEPGDIKGQMIWCYYESGKPSERIVEVVADHKGILVPVPDFDLLMVLLGDKMGISLLDEEIQQRSAARVQRYRDRIQLLDTVKHPSVTAALAKTFDRSGGWWAWHKKAETEKDLARRETVYRQGLKHCPNTAEMHTSFANFLTKDRHDYDQAEQFHKKAVKLDPTSIFVSNNFAYFLWHERQRPGEAESIYKRMVDTHPETSAEGRNALGSYANFLAEALQRDNEAERLYKRLLELDPNDGTCAGNYGEFLLIRKRFDEANRQIARARRLSRPEFRTDKPALLLLTGVLARVRGEDDTATIESLRTLLANSLPRSVWDFTCILTFIRDNISAADHDLYSSLAARISNPDQPLENIDALMRRRPKKPILAKMRRGTAGRTRRKPVVHKRSTM